MGDLSSKFRKFMRRASPLMAVQSLLAIINVFTIIVSGEFVPWAMIPIAAIGIPQFIMAAHIFFGDEDKNTAWGKLSNEERRKAAEAFRDQSKDIAKEMKRGTWDGRLPNAPTMQTLAATPPQAQTPAQPVSYDPSVENDIAQARRYKQQIDTMLKAAANKTPRLVDVANQVNDWMKVVETMAARVTEFKRNAVIQQDLKTVPEAIKKLTAQLNSETDARVRAKLEQTLAMRANQKATLEKLQSTMRQAEVQLESTVASLGTIYSQVLTAQSTNQAADYGHLASEVSEQVNQLQDQIEAIEEVKLGQPSKNLR